MTYTYKVYFNAEYVRYGEGIKDEVIKFSDVMKMSIDPEFSDVIGKVSLTFEKLLKKKMSDLAVSEGVGINPLYPEIIKVKRGWWIFYWKITDWM